MTTATDTQTPEALAEAYLPLAFKIARQWSRLFPWLRDEFESAAPYALWHAALSYRPQRGAAFYNLAHRRVWGACQDACRASQPSGFRRAYHTARREGLPEPGFIAGIEDEDGRVSMDNFADDSLPLGWELDSAEAIDELTRKLPNPQRTAIRLYFKNADMTCKRIGQAMGFGEPYAYTVIQQGLAKLRKVLVPA